MPTIVNINGLEVRQQPITPTFFGPMKRPCPLQLYKQKLLHIPHTTLTPTWRAEFIKQVLPRLLRPHTPGSDGLSYPQYDVPIPLLVVDLMEELTVPDL